MIELKNVEKVYNKGKENEVRALKNINLSINDGEMVAVIGESGSGKSTLLHILGGLDKPDSGEILYQGEKVKFSKANWMAEYRNKKVGFVLQNFGLLSEESVLENVCIPLYFNSGSVRQMKSKALESLKLVGIDDLAKRKVKHLSGGQMQRVAIARALVNNPGIILADEPTGALDSDTTEEIMSVFTNLNKSGRTIVIVTHDPIVASTCPKLIKISDGVIM